MTRAAFGAEFLRTDCFLDTPTMGLPPTFVTDGLRNIIESWEKGYLQAPSFDGAVEASREAYAALARVPVESVAMGGSVSALIGLVAASVPDGSRVATFGGEFTSVTFPFAAQAGRGVTVSELPPGRLEQDAGHYDVIAVSLVQSANGAVLDVDKLGANLGEKTLTVIDLTQALGWKNVDMSWADVTVGASYKWLLAPRGVAWMSLSDRIIGRVVPHAANWYAGQDPWDAVYGLPLRLASTARRFDTSPAWFSVYGAALSLPWFASLDRAMIEAHTVGLANRLRTELHLPPMNSAIVSIPIPDAEQRLREADIQASVRAGAVRVGFHLYNNDDDLNRLVDALT